ncbi:MarR family winged helix-turn-helix transcriptional regulator [Acidicapsa acidisoli]|uniref:MarR family winged helix-turn-helix transcriptional regulator n=1 Tax=Acidicapsa acidisoli TaxID=1615681 RepID=UPI0037BFDFC3
MAANSQGSEQAPSFSSPHEEALLNLMRSADCLHRAMQQRLKPSGLTLTQYNVLRILRSARPAGLTCSSIGRMMITPEPDITRLLARLKAQSLLCQQRDLQDRRVVWSRITDLGLEVLGKLDSLVEQGPRELLQELTREELYSLTRLLRKARCCAAGGSSTELQSPVSGKLPSPRSTLLPPHHE